MTKAQKISAVIILLTALLLTSVFIVIKNGRKKTSSSDIQDVVYNEGKDIFTCKYRGIERSFILCLPNECNKQTKLVLMLHGLGASAASFKTETQFEKTALPLNYAVAYVDGTVDPANRSHGKGWHFHEDDFSVNDISFLKDLVIYLQKEYSLGKKAFVTGFSNGGFMVNKLASSCPEIFTAAASVAGMMPKDVWESKKSSRPCAYIQINGTKDDVVPMDFNGSAKYNQNPSMEKVIEYYRKGNKSPSSYTESKLSDVSTIYSYGTKVAWVIIDGGYHSWPKPQFAQFEPEKVILEFFEKQ